jgi:hypothetical protein
MRYRQLSEKVFVGKTSDRGVDDFRRARKKRPLLMVRWFALRYATWPVDSV